MKSVFLASNEVPDLSKINPNKLASIKLDGIRCHLGSGVLSRNMKQIPNKFINNELSKFVGTCLDGEIMVRGAKDFNDVQSAVMSVHGEPDFYLNVFDCYKRPLAKFTDRVAEYTNIVADLDNPRLRALAQLSVRSAAEIELAYDASLAMGYEGLILKDPSGYYKTGRSTLKQELQLKLKPFEDDEAVVVDLQPLYRNLDTSTKRKENMVVTDMLGAFVVEWKGKLFEVGGGKGVTHDFRSHVWRNKPSYLGRTITFQYMGLSQYGIPRHPTFKAFRDAGV